MPELEFESDDQAWILEEGPSRPGRQATATGSFDHAMAGAAGGSARDFLVIYDDQPTEVEFLEGHDHAATTLHQGTITVPADDRIVVDLHDALDELRKSVGDISDVQIRERTDALGSTGRAVATLGAAVGLLATITFLVWYPAAWNGAASSATARSVIVNLHAGAALAAAALLAVGNVMAIRGRRIQARAVLRHAKAATASDVAGAMNASPALAPADQHAGPRLTKPPAADVAISWKNPDRDAQQWLEETPTKQG